MRKLLLIIPALAVALTACYPVSTLPADFHVATAESSETLGLPAQTSMETEPVRGENNNLIALGDWGTVSNGSLTDGRWHDIEMRITKITTETENEDYISNTIALSNSLSVLRTEESALDKLRDCIENPELVVVDYEVKLPEDYPCDGNADVSLCVVDDAGEHQIIKLLTTADSDMTPGLTYAKRGIYVRTKGDTNYTFKSVRYLNEADIEARAARADTDTYFANK